MDYYILFGILISLLFSAFFSGIEIAFVSADKLHTELQSQRTNLVGRSLAILIRKPSLFIGTTLIGNTIALVLYGTFMAMFLEPILSTYITDVATLMILQTIISTVVVLITAEFLPKSLFMINPNKMLTFFAVAMRVITILLRPLVKMVVWLSRIIIIHVFKAQYSEEKPVYGLTDLNNFIKNITRIGEDNDHSTEVSTDIFSNALDFKTIKIRECMIPRTEVVAIEIEASIDDLRKLFIQTGYSKIVVYKENIDDVIGYCHSSELFKKPKDIQSIVTDILIVPETTLANDIMTQFIQKQRSMAVVVDEFGGTAGIVTMEDVIEEIFGEINDEHDAEDLVEQILDDGVYLFSGRHEVEYLNQEYNLEIPEGDFDTLGGYIMAHTGEIPRLNDVIKLDKYTITIKSMAGVRVDKVKLIINDASLDTDNND